MERIVACVGGVPIEIPTHFGRYEYVRTIGSGSFSVVLLVRCRGSGREYACKVCSRSLLSENGIFDRFEREVRILQTLSHPSLVQLCDVVYDPEFIFVIMEYCENGELYDWITSGEPLDDTEIRRIFARLLEGMVYVHSHDIAHRDIKPDNILMDKQMNPKIGDFGLSHHLTKGSALLRTQCGSILYSSPEILNGDEYDGKAADVWSLGVVLFVMVTGGLPFTNSNQGTLLKEIASGTFMVPSTYCDPLDSLLAKMLAPDPKARATMAEVLKHPWVSRRLSSAAEAESPARPVPDRRVGKALKRPITVRFPTGQSRATLPPTSSVTCVPAAGSSRARQLLLRGPHAVSSGASRPVAPSFGSAVFPDH
jgi:serine/threonine protein kinase